jgi:hypothetical protein
MEHVQKEQEAIEVEADEEAEAGGEDLTDRD